MRSVTTFAAFLAAVSLAACSGGGGSAVSPSTNNAQATNPTAAPTSSPTAAPTATPTSAPSGFASATFVVSNVPVTTTSSSRRRTQAISNGTGWIVLYWDHEYTNAIVLAVNASSATPGEVQLSGSNFTAGSGGNTGSATLTFTQNVPVGIHDFTLLTYNTNPGCPETACQSGSGFIYTANPTTGSPNGASLLNSGTAAGQAISEGSGGTVSFVMNGIIASLQIGGATNKVVTLTEGTSVSETSLAVTAVDASGTAIVASSGAFTNPIAFSLSDNGSNQHSPTNGTFATTVSSGVISMGSTAALGVALSNGGSGNDYALSSGMTSISGGDLQYRYVANQTGDAIAAGKGIVNATVTASASGAASATVTFASVPADISTLTTTGTQVQPELDNPPGLSAGTGSACVLNSGPYSYEANFGANNKNTFRVQGTAVTADNAGSSAFNTFSYTSGASNVFSLGENTNVLTTSNPPSTTAGQWIYNQGHNYNLVAASWQSSASGFSTASAITWTLGEGASHGTAVTVGPTYTNCSASGSVSGN